MKPSLANLPTIARRRETRTLVSGVAQDEGGAPLAIEVTLEAPGPLQRGAFSDLYSLYVERYVKGRPASAEAPRLMPSRLACGGGVAIQLNEGVCSSLACLEVMQPKADEHGAEIPGDARLDLQYLGLLLVKAPDLWDELVTWANDLFANPYAAGNSPAPDVSSSSGAASPSTPATPTSSNTEPTQGGAQTPAAEPCLGGVLTMPVSNGATTPDWAPSSPTSAPA